MLYKTVVATICSLIAFSCCVLVILGIFGLIDLEIFAIGAEIGLKVLASIAVACLLFVAILYYDD